MAIIRKGKREDLPQVLALIKELAVYEKAGDEVVVSLEELEEDGFGSDPLYYLYVAEDKGKITGIALYYIKYSTWKGKAVYLEDIVVSEAHRGKGIGSQLFEKVIAASKALGARRMEWQVLDWNEPAINFYKKYKAVLDGEWINGKLVEEQIQNFKAGK